MRIRKTKLADLLVIFLIAFLSIVLSFLSVHIVYFILEWIITGKSNITWRNVSQVLLIGCAIGSFIGIACVTARWLGLKGF